jgi:DNA-binding response OmpR family regulator
MERGTTVLVVDDDDALRLLCRVNLELDGYRVLEAQTLPAARDLLATEAVDVVLLDVHVGHEDGVDLLRELRSARPSLPVALFTGTADPVEVGEGADAVITKPFAIGDLGATVARLVAP